MDRLRAAGLEPVLGHDAGLVPADAEVVVSTAIAADNPELRVARERGQDVVHRGALLAELCRSGRLIAIAGTHGKTTTTGMVVHALRSIGADPTFFIGGELPGAGDDGGAGERRTRNSRRSWSPRPTNRTRAFSSFARTSRSSPTSSWTTTRAGAPRRSCSRRSDEFAAPASGVVLGAAEDLDAIGRGANARGARVERFDAGTPGPSQVDLSVPGHHNVLNARAALAAIDLAGADAEAAAKALASFPGMLRRQELKGERSGARIYDDYAHHPTEVRATLAALRELRAEAPHRGLSAAPLLTYQGSCERLRGRARRRGRIGVLDVYAAREEPAGPLEGVSGLAVARAVADSGAGKRVMWLEDCETAARVLAPRLRDGDLLVTIGAGDIFKLAEELVGG